MLKRRQTLCGRMSLLAKNPVVMLARQTRPPVNQANQYNNIDRKNSQSSRENYQHQRLPMDWETFRVAARRAWTAFLRHLFATALTDVSLVSMTQCLPSGGRGRLSRALAVNSKKLPGMRPFLFTNVRKAA